MKEMHAGSMRAFIVGFELISYEADWPLTNMACPKHRHAQVLHLLHRTYRHAVPGERSNLASLSDVVKITQI